MCDQTTAFVQIRQEMITKISSQCITDVFLSVPQWDELNGRGGILRDRIRADIMATGKSLPIFDISSEAKPSYDTHIKELKLSPRDPLIVVGARNLGNNLRIIAYKKDKGVLQLFGENANNGKRSYFCLCYMSDGLIRAHKLRFQNDQVSHIDEKRVSNNQKTTILWALSGQPLLWDGQTDEDAILLNTYDLRHFWKIPTGEGRFGKRGHSGDLVEELVTILVEKENVKAIKAKAAALGIQREKNYLHSAIGVSDKGDIVLVQMHGSFESVADRLRKSGVTNAIELDQGGSVSTHFVYQKKKQQTIDDSRIFSSHYFRARASALLVFKLANEEGNLPYVPTKENSTLGM